LVVLKEKELARGPSRRWIYEMQVNFPCSTYVRTTVRTYADAAGTGVVARERAMDRTSSHTGELLSWRGATKQTRRGGRPARPQWSATQALRHGLAVAASPGHAVLTRLQSSRRRWLRSSTEAAT
jgi:hypothetical protein